MRVYVKSTCEIFSTVQAVIDEEHGDALAIFICYLLEFLSDGDHEVTAK